MKQMISKRVRIGMRAAMMLAVVMTMMFATTTEALAQTYTLGGNYVKFSKFVQPDPEEAGQYVDVTEAAAGDQILVYIDYDANFPKNHYPTGDYSSNQVTVTKIYDEDGRYNGSGHFTMPAKNVTVNAVVAAQEEYTIDLTSATSQVIPKSVWILLNALLTDNWSIDLNNDGKNDLQMKEDYNESTGVSTYSVIRLAGADNIASDLSIPLSYVYPLQYNSVLFKLKSKKAVQSGWITLSGTEFTYTGQPIEPTVTVKDGNTPVAVTVNYSNNENAGEATVTVRANAEGYTGSVVKTFTIAPKPVTISGVKAKEKEYDGNVTADIDISGATITGKVDGDDLTIVTGSATFADANAGEGKNVTFVGFTLTGAQAGNYTLSAQPASVKATIKPVTGITVTIKGQQTIKVYDGVEHRVEGYTISFSNPICTVADIAFKGTDVAARIDAGTCEMGLGAEQFVNLNSNFSNVIFDVTDGFVTIEPKEVTVTTGSATKEYDGTPLTNSESSITGIVPGEKATVIAKGSQTDVGSSTNTFEIVWDSAKATNYKVVSEDLGTLIVTPKTVTVTNADGTITETTTTTVKNADGNTIVKIITVLKDINGKELARTEATKETVTDKDGKVIQTTETIKKTVTNPDGTETTTETTKETVTDKDGKLIQTTQAITTTATGADGSVTVKEETIVTVTCSDGAKTTTENTKETVTDKDGKETTTETTKETVTDKDGKVLQTTQAITTTATGADGSQTITTSKTPETDANEIYSITADGKVTKINVGASGTPANILNGIMSLDATENNNLIRYPTLGSVVIKTQPSILIAQGDEKNVLFNTTTEKNAQGQTTATSASMTVKETGGADGTGDTGPTKIAINTGGGDNGGGGSSRYTITWLDEEGGNALLSETYAYGEMPVAPTPDLTKDDDDDYTYTFKGWTPSIVTVTGDATYTAVFEATPKTGGDNGGEGVSENPDAPTSGKFFNLTWEVSKSDASSSVYDVLTISGSGEMEAGTEFPWSAYQEQIKTVIIKEDVTSIGKDVFAGFSGDHVYVTVPNGKIMSMNFDWKKSPEIIKPTDGKIDIINYLFANPSDRTSSIAFPLVVGDIYHRLAVGDKFTTTFKTETVSIPYTCYHVSEKNGKILFSKAEMKALNHDVEDPLNIGMKVDATLTAKLVAGTNNTYEVTENKATKLTFGKISNDIANGDTFFYRPENISFEGADIDIENICFIGVDLATGDKINLVVPFGDKVGSINGSRSEDGQYNYHAFLEGSSEYSVLKLVIDSKNSNNDQGQKPFTRDQKDRAATTMIVNYKTEKESGAAGTGEVYGGKSKVTADNSSVEFTGGKVNKIIGGGSRAATAEAEEEDDEIEIVSGQEYELLHDGYIVLNFYTPDAPITVNSIIIRRPGDANNDGYVDAADLVEMINAKNGKASERFNLANADIDRDGEITQDDIDAVVKLIMEQMDEE